MAINKNIRRAMVCVVASCLFSFLAAGAQVTVSGTIRNSKNVGVEFVTVSVGNSYCYSDRKGNFKITVPRGIDSPIKFLHIGYEVETVPFDKYKSGKLNVVMTDRNLEAPTVTVKNRKSKLKTICGLGMKLPGDADFGRKSNGRAECGPVFTVNGNYAATRFEIRLKEVFCGQSTLRLIVYEVRGEDDFVPLVSLPMYKDITPADQNSELVFKPENAIPLQKGRTYFAGLSVVARSDSGMVYFPYYLHKGYLRDRIDSDAERIPISLGVKVRGIKVKP